MIFADRISNVEESATLRFTPLLEKLRKEGKEVIDFAVGELEFETPEEIAEATKKALDERKTKYANVSGINELRTEICNYLKNENLEYYKDNILITNGSKQSLYNIFQVLCNKGDEVIIPVPYWVSFSEQVKLAEAKPVFVKTKEHQLDVGKIKENISKKTRAIIINSPNNPSGAVYNKDDLKDVVDLALDNNFFIVSDEAYDMLLYDGLKNFSLATLNNAKEITIVVKSFSKPFSMTGFRIGYVAAEKEIVNKMKTLQSHSSGNVSTFSQYGALAALKMDKVIIKERIKEMERRRNLAYELAAKLFDCIKPQGAFYLFPNVEKNLNDEIKTADELVSLFLEKANVAVVPGREFGMENNIRISYAISQEKIKKGFEQMEKVL